MIYYSTICVNTKAPYLMHYGVKGMKWGIRKSQRQLKEERLNRILKVKVKDLHTPLQYKADPFAIIDKVDYSGKVIQRRVYDKHGLPKYDIDTDDHGFPDKHPTGAHAHSWVNGKHGSWRNLTIYELRQNSDIVKRGKNYFEQK